MKPLLAYAVIEEDENTGGIVFARHRATAQKNGSSQYSDGEFTSVSCRRAPWADQFAETGIVPTKEAIAHGWHFECHGCGATIDEDWLNEEGLPLDGVIGTMNGRTFCCKVCRFRYLCSEKRKARAGERFLDVLREMIRKRFGDVTIIEDRENFNPHVSVTEDDRICTIREAIARFEFPGMKFGPAALSYRWLVHNRFRDRGPTKPYFTYHNGDREAFEAFAASTKKELQV